VFGGGGLTNEKAYMLGKFARVALRTSPIDYNGRFCMSSAATASQQAFGLDRGMPFPLADIAQTDAILLVGSHAVHAVSPGRSGERANLLTNPALDLSSKMPEFKVCAVPIDRVATDDGQPVPGTAPQTTGEST